MVDEDLDGIIVTVLRGGTHCGRGVAKDPDGGFAAQQDDGEDIDGFVERVLAAAKAVGCRRLVIQRADR